MKRLSPTQANRRYRSIGAVSLITLSLSACSGGSSGPENVDDVIPGLVVSGVVEDAVTPWLLRIDLFRLASRTPGTGDGTIYMRRYEDDFPVAQHVGFYTPELDTCDIRDGGSTGGGTNPPPRIDLGEVVTISTASGPWFTFEQSLDDNGEPIYSTNNGLPGALPPDATLSLAAADYPAISGYQLVEPAAPVRLLPDPEEPLTRNAVYSWMPGDSQGYMEIVLLAFDANDEFQGFKVDCEVVDDGSFTMPDDVLDFIDASQDRLVVRYARTIKRVDVVNGIVINQKSEVAE